jgi:hypothetical protein
MYLDVREGSSVYDNMVNETAQDAPEDENKDGVKTAENNMNRCEGWERRVLLLCCMAGSM